MSSKRPLVLVDLDDTLFQTARKMPEGTPRTPATLDVNGQPNGYMNPVQESFINWLLASADVVPVTARSVEAYSRVKLPFAHGAICSHGGVILQPDGSIDRDWHGQMAEVLWSFQDRLPVLSETTLQLGTELGFSLRGWVVEEEGLRHYVVTKHNESDDSVLTKVLAEIKGKSLLEGMHIHANGNNLAFLPMVFPNAWLFRNGSAATKTSTANARCWASVTASLTSASWTCATCGPRRRAASWPR